MSLFSEFEFVQENYPLAQLTWYQTGGNAEYFATVSNKQELAQLVKTANEADIEYKVLGCGSNILVRDEGFKGLVIKLCGDFCKYEFAGNKVTAGAGVNLSKLVLETVRQGLGGLETLTGIPGSIGGAVKMNAGGKFGEVGTSVESLMLMDENGEIFEKAKPELSFGYRQNNIYDSIILSVTLALNVANPDDLLKRVQEIWIYKKNNQPANRRSAGCVFKNPAGRSAGQLIEEFGMKGLKNGNASISNKHANIIVAENDCTSSEILGLIDMVRNKIREMADIDLQLEIDVW